MSHVYRLVRNSSTRQWGAPDEFRKKPRAGAFMPARLISAACSSVLTAALYSMIPTAAVAGVVAEGDVSWNPGAIPIWDLHGAEMVIGDGSNALLSISDGGVVLSGMGEIGKQSGASGSVIVTGVGSQWNSSNIIYVGGSGGIDVGGVGSMDIADGGVVLSSGGYIGTRGTGSVTVSGAGSQWNMGGDMYISIDRDSGSLRIADGGVVSTDSSYVGFRAGSQGAVTVTGMGSRWNTANIVVGAERGHGSLTIADGGAVSGPITLANLSGSTGTLNIGAPMDEAATAAGIVESETVTFGRGDGRIVFNHTDTAYLFNSAINGVGTIVQLAGATTLAGGGDFTGLVNVAGGTLLIGSQPLGRQDTSLPITASLDIQAGGVIGMTSNTAEVLMKTNNDGRLYVGNPQLNGASTAGSFHVKGDFSNSGTVYLNNGHRSTGNAGNVLRISGNYTGNGGFMHFNTVLGKDNSVSDRVDIEGDTSGTTFVVVHNVGGSGAATLNGIELIRVDGVSAGDFVQNGRIVAGTYEYTLSRGQGGKAGNWYLDSSSQAFESDPIDSEDEHKDESKEGSVELSVEVNTQVSTEVSQEISNDAGSDNERRGAMVARPESGSYTANLAASNTLFLSSLHERPEQTRYVDVLTGEQKTSSVWMRSAGGRYRSEDSAGQLQTEDNRYVLQLGGDFAQGSHDGRDRWHVGAMAGYGGSNSTTVSQVSGYGATGSVTGYGLGVYGTWLANAEERIGAHVDMWAQYGWFDNTVKGDGLAAEKYRSRGITTSVEGGYTFQISDRFFIQPKAQVIRMGVKADDHREINGTYVSGNGDGNIQTRVGVQVFMRRHNDRDKNVGGAIQPFVEANLIRNAKSFGTTMNNVTLNQAGAGNSAEMKIGAGGEISQNLHAWGRVGLQVGRDNYRDASVTGGVRYVF